MEYDGRDAEVQLLLASEYFDADWYSSKYLGRALAPGKAAAHYLKYAVARNLDPSPRFSTYWYLQRNEDVAASGMNPLVHFELYGKYEERLPIPDDRHVVERSVFWRENWYRDTYLAGDSSVDALEHFVTHWATDGTNPCQYFSCADYLEENPDVAAVGINPVVHYEVHGKFEHRNIVKWERTMQLAKTGFFTGRPNPPLNGPVTGADIKIFVACATDSYVPAHPLLNPIQVGAALRKDRFVGMQPDDTGKNISDRNPFYCELTAQYWAWKNADADYFGFFHHRRYFSFEDDKLLPEDANGYVAFDRIDETALNTLRLDEPHMRDVIESHDIVVMTPKCIAMDTELGEDPSLHAQYDMCPGHFVTDLDLAVETIRRDHPDYEAAVDEYLSMSEGVVLNMFIMKRALFHQYGEWLFPILDTVYRSVDVSKRSVYGQRFIGFVAERLLGVFLLHQLQTRPDLRVHYSQVALFQDVTAADAVEIAPAFGDDAVVIALASDDKYALPLTVMLQSIIETGSPQRNYDILIFDNGLTPLRKSCLVEMVAPHTNVSVRFVDAKNRYRADSLKRRYHMSTTTYARFLILDVLKAYPKVLYLDSDMVVTSDVAELFDTDVAGCYVAAVRDTVMAAWCHAHSDEHDGYVKFYLKKQRIDDYFNAGVLLFNVEEFRKHYSADTLFQLAAGQDFRWMDQDVLNVVCDGRVVFLDSPWNVMVNTFDLFDMMSEEMRMAFEESMGKAKIIHYAGGMIPCFHPGGAGGEEFWKYAQQSPAYRELRVREAHAKGSQSKSIVHHFGSRLRRNYIIRTASSLIN